MLTTILVTAAGNTGAVNFLRSLREQQEVGVRLVAMDPDPLATGLYMADVGYRCPHVSDPNYWPFLLEMCRREQIAAAVPVFPSEVIGFARHSDELAAVGTVALVPTPDVCELFASKTRTIELFQQLGLRTPRCFSPADGASLPYPVFVKPDRGSGSERSGRIESLRELEQALDTETAVVVQELITGTEITIDFVADRGSRLLGACARSRLSTRGGQTIKGESLDEPVLVEAVRNIVERGRLVGPGNVQVFRTADGDIFSEVNTRPASGGLMNSRAAGVDVPLLWLREVLGRSHVGEPVVGRPGVLMLKYWSELLVPTDARDSIRQGSQRSG